LNIENCEQAEVQHVTIAVNSTLDSWCDTYFRDLWDRSDQQQRGCLRLLSDGERRDIHMLAQQSGTDEQTIRQTLQILLKRDLVQSDQQYYQIAAPIFFQWLERRI